MDRPPQGHVRLLGTPSGEPWRSTLQLPGANQYCLIFDSTRAANRESYTLASSMYVPGGRRNDYGFGRVKGHIYCTSQNMTLRYYYLRADQSFDTTTDKADETITAGTAKPLSWAYSNYGQDFAIVAIAGATPPGAIYAEIGISWDIDSGVA